ncbi:MAG: DUF2785 domain-containing protein [Anaerolineae bacterium]
MPNEAQLKQQLQTIAANEFNIPADFDLFPLALNMLQHNGSIDSELRDGLIYSAFGTWIIKHKLFTPAQLTQLLEITLDDQHLFYRIGEFETDSVFTRSFSMLMLPLILIRHCEESFLTAAHIKQIKSKLFDYVRLEQDLRGYVPEKGWAHAAAHGADAFDDLALCPELDAADLLDLLTQLNTWITTETTPFVHEEDERFVTAVISIRSRKLIAERDIEKWIRALATQVKEAKHPSPTNRIYINVKNFLRSLYFRLYRKNSADPLCAVINEALAAINNFKV